MKLFQFTIILCFLLPSSVLACSVNALHEGNAFAHTRNVDESCRPLSILPTLDYSVDNWRQDHHKHVPLYISETQYKNPQETEDIEERLNINVNSNVGYVGTYKSSLMVKTHFGVDRDHAFSMTPMVQFKNKKNIIEAGYNTQDGFLFNLSRKF